MIKKINGFLKRKELVEKVNDLVIEKTGIDKEGDFFVKLEGGPIFFGEKSNYRFDKFLYKFFLSGDTKTVLKPETLQVAIDIVIRYQEGALKYGGPKKQSRYSVKKGDIVSEMGAYQGFCSIKLAEQVGENGRVICIEPMPDNFRLLKKNMSQNNFNHVICVNKAVWHEKKEMNFKRRKNDNQSSTIEMDYEGAEHFTVDADTLDNIFSEVNCSSVDFMIIQLNGAEINGLRSLRSFKPKNLSIAARYDTEGVDAAEAIRDLLTKRGYSVEIDQSDFVFAKIQ